MENENHVFRTKEEVDIGMASLQFMKHAFRKYVDAGHKEWEPYLEAATYALGRLHASEYSILSNNPKQ